MNEWQYAGKSIPAGTAQEVFNAIGTLFRDLEGVRSDLLAMSQDLGETIARVDNQAAYLQQQAETTNAPVGVAMVSAMMPSLVGAMQATPKPQASAPIAKSPHRSSVPTVVFQSGDVVVSDLIGTDRAFRFRLTIGVPFVGGEIVRFQFGSPYQGPPIAHFAQTDPGTVGQVFPRETQPPSSTVLGLTCDPAAAGTSEFSVIVVSPSESFD